MISAGNLVFGGHRIAERGGLLEVEIVARRQLASEYAALHARVRGLEGVAWDDDDAPDARP